MRFHQFILTAPMLLALSSANCHDGGPEIDLQIAIEALGTVSGYMQGYFAEKQVKYYCIPDFTSGNSWFFQVEVLGTGRTLDYDTVHTNLGRQIQNPDNGISCPRGGSAMELIGVTFDVGTRPGTCYDAQYLLDHSGNFEEGKVERKPENVRCESTGDNNEVDCHFI